MCTCIQPTQSSKYALYLHEEIFDCTYSTMYQRRRCDVLGFCPFCSLAQSLTLIYFLASSKQLFTQRIFSDALVWDHHVSWQWPQRARWFARSLACSIVCSFVRLFVLNNDGTENVNRIESNANKVHSTGIRHTMRTHTSQQFIVDDDSMNVV